MYILLECTSYAYTQCLNVQIIGVRTLFNVIIDSKGNFREIDNVISNIKPFEYEYSELRCSLRDFLDIYCGGRLGANTCKPGISDQDNGEFIVYGLIVTKRKKACLDFYAL